MLSDSTKMDYFHYTSSILVLLILSENRYNEENRSNNIMDKLVLKRD